MVIGGCCCDSSTLSHEKTCHLSGDPAGRDSRWQPRESPTDRCQDAGRGNNGCRAHRPYDGITQWHPAFLDLGQTLEECAERYRQFCARYRSQPKPERKSRWGSRKLAGLEIKGKPKKISPGQMALWEKMLTLKAEEILEVARKFIEANCFDPKLGVP